MVLRDGSGTTLVAEQADLSTDLWLNRTLRGLSDDAMRSAK